MLIDITGKKFGKLTVLRRSKRKDTRGKSIYWECLCECGNIHIVNKSRFLKNKTTISCPNCITWKKPNSVGELTLSYFNTLKSKALERNLVFNVSREYLWELFLIQNKLCALSGVELKFSSDCKNQNRIERTASLDRLESNMGYIEGNIQWVHKRLNVMKMHFSQDEFLNFCKLITEKRKNNL